MKFKDKVLVRAACLLPPNFPTDLAEAFDDLKRAFWKAAAPAAFAKEKIKRVYLEREVANLNDRIDELESIEPGSELEIMQRTNMDFRRTIKRLQDRVAELEEENLRLRGGSRTE